jgi:hypothetical protein
MCRILRRDLILDRARRLLLVVLPLGLLLLMLAGLVVLIRVEGVVWRSVGGGWVWYSMLLRNHHHGIRVDMLLLLLLLR